jgi:hypothetical protein
MFEVAEATSSMIVYSNAQLRMFGCTAIYENGTPTAEMLHGNQSSIIWGVKRNHTILID